MRKALISISLLIAANGLFAQSGLSMADKMMLKTNRMELTNTPFKTINTLKAKRAAENQGNTIMAIAKLADGATVEELKAEGVNVLKECWGFVFLTVKADDAERIASLKAIKNIQLERPVQQKLKYARQLAGVDQIHQGIGLSKSYTGKGVVTAIIDQGFDINHVNFKDAAGEPRVKYFEKVQATVNTLGEIELKREIKNTPELIKSYKTDNTESYHGTHTMGIMAGSYKGDTKAAAVTINEAEKVYEPTIYENISNLYYGVATDADIIAATCKNMSDIEVAFCAEDLAGYGVDANLPLVMNLSLGYNTGSHDGTSLVSQFFDALASKLGTKVVFAAGNEGDLNISLNKTFTADDKQMKTFFEPVNVNIQDANGNPQENRMRYGSAEIYSNTSTPFEKVELVIFNKSRGSVTKRFSLTMNDETKGTMIGCCSNGYEDTGLSYDASFNNYFEGYMALGWGIEPYSGRMYAITKIAVIDNLEKNLAGNYEIGIIVYGAEGQRVDVFCEGNGAMNLANYGISGWTQGSGNGSMSDFATTKSVLAVGAYTSCPLWAQLDGFLSTQKTEDGEYKCPANKVTPFSSYGTTIDGRNLPHVIAPGAFIISSMSKYYLEAANSTDEGILTAVALNDRRDPWGWQAGTSQASPFVAGVIALWLEANPELTMDEIKDIIKTTAQYNENMVYDDPIQVGAGLIDAYAGLKEVIRRKDNTGIKEVSAEKNRLLVTQSGDRTLKVFVGGESELNIEVFDIAGTPVASKKVSGDEGEISLSGTAKGTYVIRVNGRMSKCFLLK